VAIILATQEAEIRRMVGQRQLGQVVHKTISKVPEIGTQKKDDGVNQVVECLPSKREALSSNSSIKKKRKRKEEGMVWWLQ
jgi:hypothetical protein